MISGHPSLGLSSVFLPQAARDGGREEGWERREGGKNPLQLVTAEYLLVERMMGLMTCQLPVSLPQPAPDARPTFGSSEGKPSVTWQEAASVNMEADLYLNVLEVHSIRFVFCRQGCSSLV